MASVTHSRTAAAISRCPRSQHFRVTKWEKLRFTNGDKMPILDSSTNQGSLCVTTSCKILTVAAMLLHSIFGCGLDHLCACESHEHVEIQDIAPATSCGHDHSVQHRKPVCSDQQLDADLVLTANGCGCCERGPCERGDSPCCSVIQCSFIPTNDVELPLDFAVALFAAPASATFFIESRHASTFADSGGVQSGFVDSLSRCSMHCSWQI